MIDLTKSIDNKFKSKIVLTVTLIFIYILLFQFILPVNKVLPKPSLLIESFIIIWSDYNLLTSLAVTSTVIYLSLILSSIVIYWLGKVIIMIAMEYRNSYELVQLLKYFPAFFFAIIFVYWFGNSIWGELLFAFCISLFFLKRNIFDLSINVKETYIITAKNLGLLNNEIYSDVIKKAIFPKLYNSLKPIHNYLWIIILIYEFISQKNGLGGVYYTALLYNDFTALFSVAILISLLIWIGDFMINFITKKIFFWESD